MLWLLAGPNGSGKSTFYHRILETVVPTYINPDLIAEEFAKAGRAVDWNTIRDTVTERRRKCFQEQTEFATETVFSHACDKKRENHLDLNPLGQIRLLLRNLAQSGPSPLVQAGGPRIPKEFLDPEFQLFSTELIESCFSDDDDVPRTVEQYRRLKQGLKKVE